MCYNYVIDGNQVLVSFVLDHCVDNRIYQKVIEHPHVVLSQFSGSLWVWCRSVVFLRVWGLSGVFVEQLLT